jgi:hypothetical protein
VLECDVQAAVLAPLRQYPRIAWAYRINVGAVRPSGRGRSDQLVRFAFKGCSDIIGQLRTGQFLVCGMQASRRGSDPEQEAFPDGCGKLAAWPW